MYFQQRRSLEKTMTHRQQLYAYGTEQNALKVEIQNPKLFPCIAKKKFCQNIMVKYLFIFRVCDIKLECLEM